MLGVDVTEILIVIAVSLGSVISDSVSGDGLEWEFVGVQWVLWSGKWGCLGEGSFPLTIVLGVNVTQILIVISVSLGSIIGDSVSRNGLEWKLVGVQWVLWSCEWSSLLLGESSFP